LEGEIVMRELRSLQELWLTIPLEVRSAREIAVEKFSGLNLEEVRRATMLHLEHSAYDDLRSRDATTSEEQRPSEPEETDPIYRGYRGYRRTVASIAEASWHWQVDVPCPTGGNIEGRLPIRCRGGVFQGDAVEIGQPCLWVFDCRRGTTGGEDVCWIEVEYGNVMQHVKKWMEGIHRWNVIFLLSAGIFFDDSMWTRFGLAAECTLLRGVWIFEAATVVGSGQDLRTGGQVEQSVQAIGGVAIVMEHPTGSRAVENIVRTLGGQLPLAFTDTWNEDRMPRAADTLERSPTELQRMVRAYLPPSWCLVAVGITTSVVDIV
jgi:hypothetical protein